MAAYYTDSFIEALREDAGALKCAAGNKPCGRRCVPQNAKCSIGERIAGAVANLAQKIPGSRPAPRKERRLAKAANAAIVGGAAAYMVHRGVKNAQKNKQARSNNEIARKHAPAAAKEMRGK